MAYGTDIRTLFSCLKKHSPAQVSELEKSYRNIEHGLLSVGIKVHVLQTKEGFANLIDELGGPRMVVRNNKYRGTYHAFCMVLPPVGSARAAISLLECMGVTVGEPLFGNPNVQLQICSPGRLDQERSALHAILFYLGSDTLRQYTLNQFLTTASEDATYKRGRRLVLYDAAYLGGFERDYEWWKVGQTLVIEPMLPFRQPARTDILAGTSSHIDVRQINLIASLLVHAQFPEHRGYWHELGRSFENDARLILKRHELLGLLTAPWVHSGGVGDTQQGDMEFFAALQELTSYAFEERDRMRKKTAPTTSLQPHTNQCILDEVDELLAEYAAVVKFTASQRGKRA